MTKDNIHNVKIKDISSKTTDNYFSFFEYSPIALVIEDFSEAKEFIKSIVLENNVDIKTYIENNPMVISKILSLTKVKEVNAKAVQLYKAKNKRDLIDNIRNVYPEKSGKEYRKLITDILTGVKETEIETVNKTLDGKEFNALIKFNLVENANEEADNLILSIENITKNVADQRALVNSENRYKESEIIAKVGSWFYNLETKKIECTNQIFKILEETPKKEQFNINYFLDFVHPEDRKILLNYNFNKLLKNPNIELKYRIITKKGTLKYILEKRNLIKENNKFSRIIGIIQDISENVFFEQKLNTTKNLLSNTLSGIKDGFVILDKSSKYLYVNEQASAMLGKSSEELIGKQMWKEFPVKDDNLFYTEYVKALSTKKPISFESYFEPWDRWFENRIIPSKDEVLIFFHEITDKKRSENTIKEAYNIINKSPTIAILCKNEFNFPVLFASENSEKLFGYTQSEFLNRKLNIYDVVHPEDLPMIREKIFKKIKYKKAKGFEAKPFRIITKESKIKWIHARFDFTKDENKNITHIQAIVEDITDKKRTQDLYHESNQRLQNQFENTPLASIIWNKDFKVIQWNNAAERIFEYTAKEACGKHIKELIIPKTETSKVEKIWNGLLQQKGGYRSTNKNITKTGKEIICDWYNVTLKDAEGNITGVASMGNDITENINSKKLLEKSEKKYRDIFEKSMDAVIIIKNGVITNCNEATLKVFGYSDKKELIKLHPADISPQLQPNGENSFYEAQKLMKTALEKGSNRFQWYHKKKNGQVFPVEVSLTKIEESDNIIRIHAVVKDISERVKKEELESVLYNISKAALTIDDFNEFNTFIKNQLHKIIDTTNFYIALYNKENKTISLPFVVDEKDKTEVFPLEKSLTGLVIKTEKSMLVSAENHKHLIEKGIVDMIGEPAKIWAGVPLKTQTEVFGAIGVQSYKDGNAYNQNDLQLLEFVADQISIAIQKNNTANELKKALVKAQESDKLKSAFLANMSHEIRTPMNGIIGFSELFLNSDLPEDVRKKYAEIVINSSKQLLSIVNDILDISKIEAGAIQLNYTKVNINKLLDNVYTFYAPIAKKQDLKFTCVKGLPDNDSIIKIDKTKLHQVLTNLLSNAFKFTDNGSVEIGYKLKNNNLNFYVKDTGIGIDKKIHTTIFERFTQGNLDLDKQTKGTGLGLSISKKFIELFKGEIKIESNNKGTTVLFTIPFKKANENTKTMEREIDIIKSNAPSNKQITLLVAEDEEYNMLYINELFSTTPYKIIEAINGKEAIDLALAHSEIDMVFMDIKMPIVNGNEAMLKIKQAKPDLPVIALSAFAMESDKENALNKGFDDYLTKPIDRKKIFELINHYASLIGD
ncbi:PAS domain S-box protein [Lutibacter sp. A64]|uniref:PAS domain S-box protein n=1 Tax=Lutibacter sp. A64 TaxID=2918526 RepID=UPI001F06F2F8|nr:PAS domain S-box protein [Lutibacter sp. A64]UMB53164.1 PAS domain S-box protein [Lutibacter sp. A64]